MVSHNLDVIFVQQNTLRWIKAQNLKIGCIHDNYLKSHLIAHSTPSRLSTLAVLT